MGDVDRPLFWQGSGPCMNGGGSRLQISNLTEDGWSGVYLAHVIILLQ